MPHDYPESASPVVALHPLSYERYDPPIDWLNILLVVGSVMAGSVGEYIDQKRRHAAKARFVSHEFDARSFNTLAHHIDYDGRSEPAWTSTFPSEPSPRGDDAPWSELWPASSGPPRTVYLWWLSLDGTPLEALVDLGEVVYQRRVVRRLVRARRGLLDLELNVCVFLEINDRTVNVYVRPGIGVILPPTGLDVDVTWRWHVSRIWSRTFSEPASPPAERSVDGVDA